MTSDITMRRLLMVLAISFIAACGHQPVVHHVFSQAQVEGVIQRVLRADTSQLRDSLIAITEWGQCADVEATDFIEPVARIAPLEPIINSDSAVVPVVFDVLGRSVSGEKVASFDALSRIDTIKYVVAPDSLGSLRVQCGLFHTNHPGISLFMRDWVPYLDSTSKAKWQSTLNRIQKASVSR